MSFTTNKLLLIGLICVVGGSACLLYTHYRNAEMSDRAVAVAKIVTVPNASSSAAVILTTQASSSPTASIAGGATVSNSEGMQFEVVTTQTAQNRGLGGRAVIPDNYAMLFVFPHDQEPGFWMKDMLTSIDMIWVTDSGIIVAIDSSVSPTTYPKSFYPPQPIRYVLETRAGFAQEKGWTIGTHVTLPLPY